MTQKFLCHRIPVLDKIQESELIELVSSFTSQMKNFDRAIGVYVETRSTNLLYQDKGEVVHATMRVGFGFLIPAINKHNVLYRDMTLPMPLHLMLRLVMRFQESRLLLP